MAQISYDIIAPQAEKLITKMVEAKDIETAQHYWNLYLGLLKGSGWDLASFDKEMLKRIDEGWEEAPKPLSN